MAMPDEITYRVSIVASFDDDGSPAVSSVEGPASRLDEMVRQANAWVARNDGKLEGGHHIVTIVPLTNIAIRRAEKIRELTAAMREARERLRRFRGEHEGDYAAWAERVNNLIIEAERVA